MPIVRNSDLPTYRRLQAEGETIISPEQAQEQQLAELHIGLLNMMPDSALEATERQFFRLVSACRLPVKFHMHLFTVSGLVRNDKAQAHIKQFYEPFTAIKAIGLNALIISGANVTHNRLQEESFWGPLTEVFDWAKFNVTSILCSCLATHALIQYAYGIVRTRMPSKRWGVFPHCILDQSHPLLLGLQPTFDVPHSRFNEIFAKDMRDSGLRVLVTSEEAGVHLAVSADGFHIVFFQGHPEYDDISLLKEYKREVVRFFQHERSDYPPLPEHFFPPQAEQLCAAYQQKLTQAKSTQQSMPPFPEDKILPYLINSWGDTAKTIFDNWLTLVLNVTNHDRSTPYRQDKDPTNPLNL